MADLVLMACGCRELLMNVARTSLRTKLAEEVRGEAAPPDSFFGRYRGC